MAMAEGLLSSVDLVVERLGSWLRTSFRGSVPPSTEVPPLQDHLSRLRRMLPRIQAVLDDAEEMEIQDKHVKLWLREIRDVAYDADDVLDEYHYELVRAEMEARIQRSQAVADLPHGGGFEQISSIDTSPSWLDASFWGKLVCRVEKITDRFEEISKQRDALHLREGVGEKRRRDTWERPPSTPVVGVPNIYGRENDINKLMSRIFSPGGHNPSVVSVVGMGGVGKTTLVQRVYNDQAVCEHFKLRGWVCVSDDFEVPQLTKRIVEAITKERCDLSELSVLHEKLVGVLSGKRFLLVLDDLWNQEPNLWLCLQAPLQYGSQGSTIIITTRNESVAKITQTMPCLSIGCLPFDACWAIFKWYAFQGRVPGEDQDLLEVGKKIVRKCNGLPLASTTLGGLLRYESDTSKWNAILTSEIWDLGENSKNNILPTLMLSYIHLPTHLKRCFAYCAVFPKDFSFTKDQLVRMWMSQGFIQLHKDRQFEEMGVQYFDELLQRSFFQPSHEYSPEHEQGFVMHDLIHDLAVSISGGECSIIKNEDIWSPSYESWFLRHIAFVPHCSDLTVIFQSLCCDGLAGLRSLLLVRRSDLWVKNDVVTEIPNAAMQRLETLRALDLSYVHLKHLPDSIGNMKHLRYLDASRTRIDLLPESICQLYLLQAMDLSYTRITELPDSIWNLKQLRYLNVCHTSLTMLPGTVGELVNLRTLDMGYTGLKQLLNPVGNLRHLTFLDLSGTEITSFPEPICRLYNLRTLNLNNVAIKWLPHLIGSLQSLRHLNLNETRIETLPESICNLRQLQMLNLSFSRLRELPESMGNLGRLCHLDVSNTKIEKLPASICKIHGLQSLLLKSCSDLRSLPDGIGWLTNLKHLDFNARRVYMPSGIGRLTCLRTLPVFNVGDGVCGIRELMDLTGLRGRLQISGLKYVINPVHASMANLRAKTEIDKLVLDWESSGEKPDENASPAEEISSTGNSSLEGEQSCKPAQAENSDEESKVLGEAEESEVLEAIRRKKRGFWIRRHFFRKRRDERLIALEESVILHNLQLRTRPAELELLIKRYHDLMWNTPISNESKRIVSIAEQSVVLEKLQPHARLTELQVRGYGGHVFPKWMADPSFSRLVKIVIEDCANCSHLPALGQLPSLKQLRIAGASSVQGVGREYRFDDGVVGRGAFLSLESMTVEGMTGWAKWEGVERGDFPRLAWLEVTGCPSFRGNLPNSTYPLLMLKVLKLEDCPSLFYVPLHNVPNLRTAAFHRCEQLLHIDFGNHACSSLFAATTAASSTSSSSSSSSMLTTEMPLRSLRMHGCPRVQFLPREEHMLPRTLTHLDINDECHRLLDWFKGDGRNWLAQIPYTKLWKGPGGLFVGTFPEPPSWLEEWEGHSADLLATGSNLIST